MGGIPDTLIADLPLCPKTTDVAPTVLDRAGLFKNLILREFPAAQPRCPTATEKQIQETILLSSLHMPDMRCIHQSVSIDFCETISSCENTPSIGGSSLAEASAVDRPFAFRSNAPVRFAMGAPALRHKIQKRLVTKITKKNAFDTVPKAMFVPCVSIS